MTDRQLCEMYDRTEHKTSAIVRAMYQEKCTLADIVRRLKKLGYKPERSLRYTFGCSLPEQISKTRLREFAARKKIPTAPGTEQKCKKNRDDLCLLQWLLLPQYGLWGQKLRIYQHRASTPGMPGRRRMHTEETGGKEA